MPISDTLTVIINRINSGKSPFIGGKDHTTHYLFYNGFTEKKIALIFLFITLMGCYLSYLIIYDNSWSATKFILYAIFPVLVCSSLFIITKRKKKTNK
jgi:UDP-GlcNAc:undecaprenyl-phosphate GlcNAc-1-phosphate transferase